MNRIGVAATASVLAIALAPVAAFAAPGVAAKKSPKPPAVGHWTVNHTATTDVEAAGGGFAVTSKHRYVKNFVVKIGPDAETACGTGSFRVLGRLKVYDAKGESEFGAYNEWVVGKNEPTADPVIQGEKVTIRRAGKDFKATFEIVFAKPRGGVTSGGEIDFGLRSPSGGCQLSFGVKKP